MLIVSTGTGCVVSLRTQTELPRFLIITNCQAFDINSIMGYVVNRHRHALIQNMFCHGSEIVCVKHSALAHLACVAQVLLPRTGVPEVAEILLQSQQAQQIYAQPW